MCVCVLVLLDVLSCLTFPLWRYYITFRTKEHTNEKNKLKKKKNKRQRQSRPHLADMLFAMHSADIMKAWRCQ